MIIDLILDRKDSEEYNARDFYYACLHYGEVGDDITRALDSGTEKDVKKALCDYVIDNDYNKNICKYINSVNWLDDSVVESKKSAKKSLKESKLYTYMIGVEPKDWTIDDTKACKKYGITCKGYYVLGDYEGMVLVGTLSDIENFVENYFGAGIAEDYLCPYNTFDFEDGDWITGSWYESKKSAKRSLKEKVTVAKSLKIIEHALLDLIHDDTIQEEFNMAFEDNGIYDSVDDMFEVSVHNVLNKLLKEHTITVLPF